MPKHSKRHRRNCEKIDMSKQYDIKEAIELIKSMTSAKFDETVEISVRLGVDAKKSDQMVRGAVQLPHGTGKKIIVLVFAEGEKAQQATDAGADFVGGQDLVDKIKEGWLAFDKVVATPNMMSKVGPIAKILGPRGLMPNPKVGTVTMEVAETVASLKAGRIEFRVEKAAIVHAPIGKISFKSGHLLENLAAIVTQILKLKPATAKGIFLKAASLASTMGPGLALDMSHIQALADRE